MCSKLCNSRKCCISIWSSWYAFLIVLIHAFLIRDRIVTILKLKQTIDQETLAGRLQTSQEHDFMWWEHESSTSTLHNNNTIVYPTISIFKVNLHEEFITRTCLTSLSILFLIVFFVTSHKKIGNFSNDGVKLGRDFFCEKLHHHHKHYNHDPNIESDIKLKDSESIDSISTISEIPKKKSFSKKIFNIFWVSWRHFLPINSMFHLLSIIFLLIQDLIYKPADLVLNELNSLNSSCPYSSNTTQCVLNILHKFETETNSEFILENSYLYEKFFEFKFEILSICLAYLTLSVRYGAVYWYTNKTLSYLISIIGLICAIEQLFQLYIFIFISKQIIFTKLSNLIFAKLKTEMVDPGPQTLVINDQFRLIILYSFLSISVLTTLIPIYSFSYLKYKERFLIEETLFVRTILGENTDKKMRKQSTVSVNKLDKVNFLEPKVQRSLSVSSSINLINQNRNCFNYCPHLIATLQLVLICALKLPFSYDLIIYFNNFKDFVLMLAIIDEILHTIILLFVWLILTLKTEWRMHLRTSFSICHWTYHLKLCEKMDEFDKLRDQKVIKSVSNRIDSESEMFNSESLYRNELRKSSKNMLQVKRNSSSVVPAYVRPENRMNRISQPAYLSTPSAVRYNPILSASQVEIPIMKSPNLVNKNQNVPSSSLSINSKPILYLKRGPASEYESRV